MLDIVWSALGSSEEEEKYIQAIEKNPQIPEIRYVANYVEGIYRMFFSLLKSFRSFFAIPRHLS